MEHTFKIGDRVQTRWHGTGHVAQIDNLRVRVEYSTPSDGAFSSWYAFEELAPAPHQFKIGDRVTIKKSGTPGQVQDVDGKRIYVNFVSENSAGTVCCTANELEPIPAPAQFKIGDRVRVKTASEPGTVTELSVAGIRVQFDNGLTYGYYPESYLTLEPAPDPAQALRYNKDKPQSDYLFTFVTGVSAAFYEDFDYYQTLQALTDLYRADGDPAIQLAAENVLRNLQLDAQTASDDVVELLAKTCTQGAAKYRVGNYLLGAPWRQHFACAVRHAVHIQNGEEIDAEGFPHRGCFFFNVIRACSEMRTGTGTDDRVRPPK